MRADITDLPPQPRPDGPDQLIYQRAKQYGQDFVQKFPVTSAHALTSAWPEDLVAALPAAVSAGVDYIDTYHTFGGIKGSLTGLHTKAMSIADPVSRRATLAFADSLKQLSPEDQQVFMAWVHGQTSPQTAGVLSEVVGAPVSTAAPTYGPRGTIAAPATSQFQITGQEGSQFSTSWTTDQIAQLYSMFPQLQGKIDFKASGITVNDLRDSFDNTANEIRLTMGIPEEQSYLQHVAKVGPVKALRGLFLGTTENAFGAFTSPIQAVAAGAGNVEAGLERLLRGSSNPYLRTTGNVLSSGINSLDTPSRVLTNAVQDLTGAIGTWFTASWWKNLALHPASSIVGNNEQLIADTMNNTRYINATGGIVLAGLLHTLGEVATASSDVGELPKEVLQAREAARSQALGSETLAGKILHPLRTFVDPQVRAAVIDAMGKTAQDWANEQEGAGPVRFFYKSTPAKLYFDRIEAVKAEADPLGAAYRQGLGIGMSQDLVKTLLDTPRDQMPSVSIEALTGIDTPEGLRANERVLRAEQAVREASQSLEAAAAPKAPAAVDPSNGLPEPWKTTPFDDTGVMNSGDNSWDPANANQVEYIRSEDLDRLVGRNRESRVVDGQTMSGEQAVLRDLKTSGFRYPLEVQVVEGTGRVFVANGNTHWAAADKLGLEWLPVQTFLKPEVPDLAGPLTLQQIADIHAQQVPAKLSDLFPDQVQTPDQAATGVDPGSASEAAGAQQAHDTANMELQAARADAAQFASRDPEQIFFPGAKYLSLTRFLRRALSGSPQGLMEHLAGDLLAPLQTVERFSNTLLRRDVFNVDKAPWITAVTNKLQSRPFLYNPESPGFNALKAEENATVINRYGRALKMSASDIDAVIKNVGSTASPVDVFNAMKDFAERRLKYAPEDMSAWGKKQLGRAFEADFFEGYNTIERTLPDGTKVSEPVNAGDVVNGALRAKPFLPSEFLARDKIYLPSLEIVKEVTSFIKRWEHSTSLLKRGIGQAWGFGKVLLQMAGRTTALPLWAAFKLPALMFKHSLDPILGNLATPGMARGSVAPDIMLQAWDGLAHPDPGVIGSVNEGLPDPAIAYDAYVPTANYSDQGALTTEGAQALLNKMRYYSQDALAHELLRSDFNVDAVYERLVNGTLSRFYDSQLKRSVGEDPAVLKGLLSRQAEAIKQASLGVPEYLDLMKSGGLISGELRLPELPAQTAADVADIRARLGELNPIRDAAAIRVLQEQLRMKMDEALVVRPTRTTVVGMEDEAALVKDIQARFDGNQLDMPRNVQVRRLGRSAYRDAFGRLHLDHGGLLEQVRELNAKMSNVTYRVFQPVGWADRTVGRTNFFVQRSYDAYAEYRAAGMSVEDAQAAATMRGSIDTKDFYYDLTTRSTAERASRNTLWFAPAGGELMYRWFYRIPAEQGNALVGNLLNFAKLTNYLNLAKSLGVIRRNAEGQLVIPIPGAGKFLNTISGGKWKFVDGEQITVPLASLDPLVTAPIPTMGPLPGKALNELSKHVAALKGVATVLAPYADQSGLIPYTLRRVAGALGIDVPDLMNADAIEEQWKRRKMTGIQLALIDAAKNDPQPTLGQYNLDPNLPGYLAPDDPQHETLKAAYQKAMRAWTDRVFSEGTHIAMGIQGASVLFGDFFPGSALVSTPQQEDWLAFLKGASGLTGANWAYARDRWLQGHPAAFPLSVSKGLYTGKNVPKGEDPTQLYADGVKEYMTPTQFLDFASAMQSKWMYDQRSYAETIGISDNAPDLLRHWSEHSLSLSQRDLAWDQYLKANPDAAAIVTLHDTRIREVFPDYGVRTDESQYIKDSMLNLQALSSVFTGEGSLPNDEYAKLVGDLKAERARIFTEYTQTGTKPDAVTAGLNWYFDSVVTPYMTETKPIWDEIAVAKAAGIPAADLYAQLQSVEKKYTGLSHDGQNYPSPGEFFFDAKTPAQQNIALVHWSSEPISFLSPFQRSQLGYKDFTGEDNMWTALAQQDALVSSALRAVAPGSRQYDAVKAWGKSADLAIAGQYGTDGVAAYNLSTAAPYVRLRALGTFSDPVMQQAYTMADQVTLGITASGGSPSGSTSPQEIALKTWFYAWVNQQTDPRFLADLDKLSLSTTLNGVHPLGASLYEAIFFNQFQPAYIGSAVRTAGAPTTSGA
jgi:hypothetical protein